MTKIAIQGVHGCFHEQAARLFYGNEIGVCECLIRKKQNFCWLKF